MAYGDDSRVRNKIDYEGGLAQNHLNNLRTDTLVPQQQELWNAYLRARGGDEALRNDVLGQFGNFAQTGGYGRQDLANIRNRALAPIRSVYQNADREVGRQRALQGGYSPGYGVIKARMARDMSQGLSDAVGNTEAGIAQMVNEGRRFGTQGLFGTYGQAPGATSMAGNQMLNATQQRLQGEGMQQNLGLGLINAQQNAAQLPGKFQSAIGNISSALNLGSQVGGMIYPWLNPGNMMGNVMAPGSGIVPGTPGGPTYFGR